MGSSSKRILFIDDEKETCELVSLILSDCDVTAAMNVSEAVKLAGEKEFDLYVIDYHFADSAGLELCPSLRHIDTKTPILYCNGDINISPDVSTQGIKELQKTKGFYTATLPQAVSQLLCIS